MRSPSLVITKRTWLASLASAAEPAISLITCRRIASNARRSAAPAPRPLSCFAPPSLPLPGARGMAVNCTADWPALGPILLGSRMEEPPSSPDPPMPSDLVLRMVGAK